MKKLTVILTLVALFAFAGSAFSQGKMSVGLGVGYNLPQGDMASKTKNDRDAAIGFGLNFGYMVNENFEAGLGIGMITFPGKSSGDNIDEKMLPIMLSGRYFFWKQDKISAYGGLNVGMTNTNYKVTGFDASKLLLSYGLKVGACYAINEKIGADFGVGYNIVATKNAKFTDSGSTYKPTWNDSFLGINLGVNYKF